MFDLNAHLRAMVEIHAPSGHEGPLRDYLSGVWEPLADDLSTDGLGSLIATKRPTRECEPSLRIMLAAHMDEIGLMVREVIDGFISLHRISGVDNRVLPAQAVIVHGRRPLPGVVAAIPPHMLPMAERQVYEPLDNLLVDVGLEPAEVEALVQPGDLITQDAPMIELQNGRLAGKAMDDRASLAASDGLSAAVADPATRPRSLRRGHRLRRRPACWARARPPGVSNRTSPSPWTSISPCSPASSPTTASSWERDPACRSAPISIAVSSTACARRPGVTRFRCRAA